MRSFKKLRAIRVAGMTLSLLILAEVCVRTFTLYPYVYGQRFHNMWSAAALAPNARQIADAVDHVRENAKPGDVLLLGDSILNGTHVPTAYSPAAVIREKLKEKNSELKAWDLTIVGADPAMYSAILERLGPIPGVSIVSNISIKLIAHPNTGSFYFPLLWDEMAHWSTTTEQTRTHLLALRDYWFDVYSKSEHVGYGENLAEVKATVWSNTHLALHTLDHWFRFHFTTEPWQKFVSAVLLQGRPLYGAKELDVIWQEWPHEPTDSITKKAQFILEWFGRPPGDNEPLWRAYLVFLELLKTRQKRAVLSLHTVSPHHLKFLSKEIQEKVLQSYERLKAPVVEQGLLFVEPKSFLREEEYTDSDHYRIAGNRHWIEQIRMVAQFY